MSSAEHLTGFRFSKGDPRTIAAAKKHGSTVRAKLLKKLKTFDAQAWDTLARLFESEKPELALEALKIWAKYRLSPLTTPTAEAEKEKQLPRMSPEFAKRVFEALDS